MIDSIYSYDHYKNLGLRLLGPIYAEYYFWAEKKLQCSDSEAVLFLSREGYHLKRMFERFKPRTIDSDYHYLEVSRAVLYKLSLLRSDLWHVALSKSYKGTFGQLLGNRFALNELQIAEIPGRVLQIEIDLPTQMNIVMGLLEKVVPQIEESIQTVFSTYKKYLDSLSVDFRKEVTVIDIGFSATTQYLLTRLFELRTTGLYLYLTTNHLCHCDSSYYANCSAYWSEEAEFGQGDLLVDWSLVQESIFTAPEGQLRDVVMSPSGNFEFVRGEKLNIQKYFYVTFPIVDGIFELINRMRTSGLTSISKYIDSRKLYEITLKFDRSPEMLSLIEVLEIDDHVSGLGNIKPFNFLPGLTK